MRRTFFGLLFLGFAVVAIAPLDANAGDWAIRLFTWSREPTVVVEQRTHGYVDISGTVWMETAPTCSGALYVIEAPALCSGAADADDDEDQDSDDDE